MVMASWKGFKHYAQVFWGGAAQQPSIVATPFTTGSPTKATDFSMWGEDYKWFRLDTLVRRCIVVNASFAVLAGGFETELELTKVPKNDVEKEALLKKYAFVKEVVDGVNKSVNFDEILFVACIKSSIFGKSGHEICFNGTDKSALPYFLLSLQSKNITPDIGEDWTLRGYKYTGKDKPYAVDKLLYITNLELENDYEGLSDVEPARPFCKAMYYLVDKDIPETTKRMWAPFVHFCVDTAGMTRQEAQTLIDNLVKSADAGKSSAFNKKVTSSAVSLEVNYSGLVALMAKLEERIISVFGTPRFLINKTPENRATAFVEFDAYLAGPIAAKQRSLKRRLAEQWYDMLVKRAFLAKDMVVEAADPPVRIRHVWTKPRYSDMVEMAQAVSALYGNGSGILAKYPEFMQIAFDMMSWNKELLQKAQETNPSTPGVESSVGTEEYVIRRRIPERVDKSR